MAINKVVFDAKVLLDLTEDTVTPETLAEGTTAHDKAGNAITGTMVKPSGRMYITQNGLYDVTNYREAYASIGTIPEGYIKPSGSLDITENGTYDISEKKFVNVNVPSNSGGGGETPSDTYTVTFEVQEGIPYAVGDIDYYFVIYTDKDGKTQVEIIPAEGLTISVNVDMPFLTVFTMYYDFVGGIYETIYRWDFDHTGTSESHYVYAYDGMDERVFVMEVYQSTTFSFRDVGAGWLPV
jgi:hypothetical protein